MALTVNGLAVSSYPDMVAVSQTAERYGFDSVWLCDHFLTISADDYVMDAGITGEAGEQTPDARPRTLPLLECWTALSALARDTTRLRLGTSVLCNSYRHPSVLAKMAATLDVISSGRLDLGLGAGWFERESDAYGIPFPPVRDRVSALEESLQVIRAVWTEPNPPTPVTTTHSTARSAIRRRSSGRTRRCGSAGKATAFSASPPGTLKASMCGGGRRSR